MPKSKLALMLFATCTAWTQLLSTSAADDWTVLNGPWQMTWLQTGKQAYDAKPMEATYVFEPGRMRIKVHGEELVTLRLRLNEVANPKEFEAWYDGDEQRWKQTYPQVIHGIYEVSGNRIRRCYTINAGQKPKTFDVGNDPNTMLQVLERMPDGK